MKSMVVLFALCAVACASWAPLAQPPHHPAIVLDPHGRPLDTAEVIGARALHLQAKALEHGHGHGLVAHAAPLVHSVVAAPVVAAPVVAAPAAVSHQSRVDVHSSPAVVAHSVVAPVAHAYAAPVAHAYAAPLAHAVAAPVLGHGLAGHGHWLKKRSLFAHSAPLVAAAPAVSHQSRVDVISSPAVHAVAAPVVAHAAPVYAHAAPVVKYVGGSAVSHQSRVDVSSSPAVVAHSVVAPVVAHSVAAPVVAHSAWAAAPVAHSYAAPLAHSYAAPLAHSYAAPYSAGLVHASPLAHGW